MALRKALVRAPARPTAAWSAAEEVFVVQRRAGGLQPDRQHAARSRRPGLVREPRRDRRPQQPGRRAAPASCRCRSTRRASTSAAGLAAPRTSASPSSRRSHQHPLGVTMSLGAAPRAARAPPTRAGAWIVEDDYDGEFYYSRPPAADVEERRYRRPGHLRRHLSQVAVPGAPPRLPRRAAGARRDASSASPDATLQGVPTSLQAIVASFIEEGHFACPYPAHAQALRGTAGGAARRRRTPPRRALLDLVRSERGFQTIGPARDRSGENSVSPTRRPSVAVTVTPISRFCLEPVARRDLILGFSACQPREIRAGVATLGEILESSLAAGGRASASAASARSRSAPRSPTMIDGRVDVARRDAREDRGVDDPQAVEAMHPQARVDHRGRPDLVPWRRSPRHGTPSSTRAADVVLDSARAVTARPGCSSSSISAASGALAASRRRKRAPSTQFVEVLRRGEIVRLDARRLERVGGADADVPRLVGWQFETPSRNPGYGSGRISAPLAGHGLDVAQRREVELQVGPVAPGIAAEEAAALVDAERQWSAARQDVAHADARAAPTTAAARH